MWEGAPRKYAQRVIRKQLWRIATTCDFDDAMQEAYLVYLRCARKYAYRVDNEAWFMALYKSALSRELVNLANDDTAYREVITLVDPCGDDATMIDLLAGSEDGEGELAVTLRWAPDEVREVLTLLLNAPTELLRVFTASWAKHGSTERYGSKLLCRVLGRPEDANLLQRVRKYLSS